MEPIDYERVVNVKLDQYTIADPDVRQEVHCTLELRSGHCLRPLLAAEPARHAANVAEIGM